IASGSMPAGISEHARVTPDKVAIVDADRVRTYRTLDERSTRLAHALAGRGIGRGGKVALMLPNSIEWFEAGAAISKLDAYLVPVNWHLKSEELGWILEDSETALLIADPSLEDAWRDAGCPVLTTGEAYDQAIE